MLLAVIALSANAEVPPLRSYYVACDPDSLDYILQHKYEDIYIACELVYEGHVWHNARLRLRGDSSRDFDKKSFKINFDADERFYGRDKINLNAQWIDPTCSREFLTYDFFRRAGMAASQTWFARLYINGEYHGLYLDVEQVDEHFLASNRIDETSNLYKASYDGAMLRITEPVEALWEKKTNETTGFYDLHELIDWIQTVPEDRFFDELNTVFEREHLARYMAISAIVCNSSTYYHNYYLVHPTSPGGKWDIIPWDVDRSFNTYWSAYFSLPYYYLSAHYKMEDVNSLVKRCWLNPQMRDLIYSHVDNLSDSLVTTEYYSETINQLDTMLSAAVEEDTYNQFSIEEFHSNLQQTTSRLLARADFMERADYEYPYPFDILPAEVTPEGIRFSWFRTTCGNGEAITYSLSFDTTETRLHPVEYYVGTDTTVVLEDLPPDDYFWNVVAYTSITNPTRSIRNFRKLSLPESYLESEIISGQLEDGDIHWNDLQKLYWIADTLTIPETTRLIIEPGVRVYLLDGAVIINHGILDVGHQNSDSVFISTLSGNNNGNCRVHTFGPDACLTIRNTAIRESGETSIRFEGSDHAAMTFENTTLSHTDTLFRLDNASLTLTLCDIYTSNTAIIVQDDESELSVRHSTITSETASNNISLISIPGDNCTLDFAHSSIVTSNGNCIEITGDNAAIYLDDVTLNGSIYASGIILHGVVGQLNVASSQVTGMTQGISSFDSTNTVTVYNSIFYRNALVFQSLQQSSTANAVFRNCAFYVNEQDVLPSDSSGMDIRYCFIDSTESDAPTHIVVGDPEVVDPWNGNWDPLWQSPLIDAGYGVAYPERDPRGQERVDVPAVPNSGFGFIDYVDIGRYEFPYGAIPDSLRRVSDEIDITIYPNPSQDNFLVQFKANRNKVVKLEVFNVLGRLVYKDMMNVTRTGLQRFCWNAKSCTGIPVVSGMYFIRVRSDSSSDVKRAVLIR